MNVMPLEAKVRLHFVIFYRQLHQHGDCANTWG